MPTERKNKEVPRPATGNPLWLLLVVAGLVLWLFTLSSTGAERAWLALLVNLLYFGPLGAGLVAWLGIIALSRGKWAGDYHHLAGLGIMVSPPSLLAVTALWLANAHWAPWNGRDLVQGAWLNTSFLLARDLLSLVLFWLAAWFFLSRRRQNRGGGWGDALFVLLYGAVFSLMGFDLVMALDPAWHSSLFGGYFAVSGLYTAVAALAFMAAWQHHPHPAFLHDIGKLMVAFSLLTAYLMYSQLLPIWYENLPGETSFVFTRLQLRPASVLSGLLLGAVYLGPLVLLLTVWAKKNRYVLGLVSGLILFGMWLERWWLVLPTLAPGSSPGLADAGMALAFLGAWGICVTTLRRWAPLPEPVRHRRRGA